MTKLHKGFTLVELLIVIGILGVLAAVVVIAINPIQQLARARDAGRKGSIGQAGTALASYYTSQNATYPTAAATWLTSLVNAGELKTAPPPIAYSVSGVSACTTNNQNGYCYSLNATSTEAIAYARLESDAEKTHCTVVGTVPYWIYVSAVGRAGGWCGSAEPTTTSVPTW